MKLERQTILDQALALLDAVGIDQLTTRRLAERLKVQQPALYWHFRNKRALLDAMNAEIMRRGHDRRRPLPGETWQDFVRANARSFRRALRAVRDGARIHAGTQPTPEHLADAEAQLKFLIDAGFAPPLAMHALIGIGRYVVGAVLEEQAEGDREDDGDGDRFTELVKHPLLASTIMSQARFGHDKPFEIGLELIIGGLERSRQT